LTFLGRHKCNSNHLKICGRFFKNSWSVALSSSYISRVTRWVCEKIAQNVAKLIFGQNSYIHIFSVEKIAHILGQIL
jgi:hypothetical protein